MFNKLPEDLQKAIVCVALCLSIAIVSTGILVAVNCWGSQQTRAARTDERTARQRVQELTTENLKLQKRLSECQDELFDVLKSLDPGSSAYNVAITRIQNKAASRITRN